MEQVHKRTLEEYRAEYTFPNPYLEGPNNDPAVWALVERAEELHAKHQGYNFINKRWRPARASVLLRVGDRIFSTRAIFAAKEGPYEAAKALLELASIPDAEFETPPATAQSAPHGASRRKPVQSAARRDEPPRDAQERPQWIPDAPPSAELNLFFDK